MTNSQMHATIIPQERVERHQHEGPNQRVRQTEVTFGKAGLSKESSSCFVKMTTPTKNNKTRNTTEYHFFHFIPYFLEIMDGIDIDDFSDDSENEED